jgi:hypothetical protein
MFVSSLSLITTVVLVSVVVRSQPAEDYIDEYDDYSEVGGDSISKFSPVGDDHNGSQVGWV